jgi:hypothetical protein
MKVKTTEQAQPEQELTTKKPLFERPQPKPNLHDLGNVRLAGDAEEPEKPETD